jgi:hypothetical protein
VSGLARAVAWTQRIGYNYPPSHFQGALTNTFPKLTEREVVHCVSEHERCQIAWNQRIWGHDAPDFSPEPSGQA